MMTKKHSYQSLVVEPIKSKTLSTNKTGAAMANRTYTAISSRKQFTNRSETGIILLVVLGMLTFFSILGVSYLVFTGRQRTAAFRINLSESSKIDNQQLMENALQKLLVGSAGPDSSLWGHDLLGDLYGMRDSIEANVMPVSVYPGPVTEVAPGMLLGGRFLRFPSLLHLSTTTNTSLHPLLNEHPNRRNDNEVERRYPGYIGAIATLPLNPLTYPRPAFPMDDEINGRLLTFRSGPLGGLTFEISSYYGDHTGAALGRAQLTGQVFLDTERHVASPVTVGNVTKSLGEWLNDTSFRIDRLFYDYPSTFSSLPNSATAYSSFYVNGRMLNGPGLGWDRPRRQFNPVGSVNQLMGIDPLRLVSASNPVRPFNLNETVSTDMNITKIEKSTATLLEAVPITGIPYQVPTPPTGGFPTATTSWPTLGNSPLPLRNGPDVPVALQGHYAIHRLAPETIPGTTLESFVQDLPPGDTDEPYDAPDYNNLWLSYFPTDEILGEKAPSFVRPALVNWIVNNQDGSPTVQRLRRALIALQRSTLRPLPFRNDPMVPSNLSNRGRGVKSLSYEDFTGSNQSAGFNEPVDLASTNVTYLQNKLIEVARALAGRDEDGDGQIDSWDVDNNGDGFVDSIWIDAGMPITQSVDGKLIKPLVSYMVEDLGGRVNVNLAGNIVQARNGIMNRAKGAIQTANPVRRPTTNPAVSPALVYTTAPPADDEALDPSMPNGWGFGPAEIDIRALFPSLGTFNVSIIESSPLINYSATNFIRGPQRLVAERLGMFSANRGRVKPFANMSDPGYGQIVTAPGNLIDPITGSGNDLRGVLRNPNRPNLHQFAHPQGLPVDTYGRTSMALGVNGDLTVSGASFAVSNGGASAGDSQDDPYEFDARAIREPDAPYTYSDLEPLLRFDNFDRELMSNRLIEIIEQFHNNQGVGQATLDQLRRALADSITTESNSVASVRGGLPGEFFENTTTSTAATSPQSTLRLAINPTGGLANEAMNAIMWELMPPELRAGGKLNLNRPFGNGFDDDSDGVIDDDNNGRITGVTSEVNEAYYLGESSSITPYRSTRGSTTPNELYNTTIGARNVTARSQFARHLYVLAMVLIRDANRNVDFDFPQNHQIPPGFTSPFYTSGTSQEQFGREYRAWKIAQWAVNVADFRDADAVMTRFDYDPNPFDGWGVNLNAPNTPTPTYRTVWGMERSELTLDESLAFHDRRVRDTAEDDSSAQESLQGSNGSATRGDAHMDQWRIPQGSLFLELRSTRSPQPVRSQNNEIDPVVNPASYPRELYRQIGSQFVLDLGAVTPVNNIPVWRVAISEIHSADAIPAPAATANVGSANTSPEHLLSTDMLLQPFGSGGTMPASTAGVTLDRDTFTGQPEQPQFFSAAFTDPVIDRVVFFSNNVNPTAITSTLSDVRDEGQVFYNRLPSAAYPDGGVYVRGGQHVMIGPRRTTHIGSRQTTSAGTETHDPSTNAPIVAYTDYESLQRIELSANQVVTYDLAGTSKTPIYDGNSAPVVDASIRPVIGIEAAADAPSAWMAPGPVTPIGVNVSEPLPYNTAPTGRSYYTQPTDALDSGQGYPTDSYRDYGTASGALPDRPFDDRPAMSELYRAFGPLGQQTGTREHFKTAYLQRLADPTQPYHVTDNPYRTVDFITIDLTVFNGSDDNTRSLTDVGGTALWVDDSDHDPYSSLPNERFASRYKTGKAIHEDPADVASVPNLLYSVNTFPPEITTPTVGGPNAPHFKINLNVDSALVNANDNPVSRGTHSTTLGYLNYSYGDRWQQGATPSGSGAYNEAQINISPFIGLPYNGFAANVQWLNRPYVSAEELMWVPVSGPGRFSLEFSSSAGFVSSNQYSTAQNMVTDPPPVPPALPNASLPVDDVRHDFNQRFTHLWNYFSSNNGTFAFEPATYEAPGGTTKPNYPWLPPDPSAANGFVGMPASMPAMTAPYPPVPKKTPSPNFWRLLEWVEVPPPYDFDITFVSPEQSPFIPGEQALFCPRINFASLGNVPPVGSPGPIVDGDPRSWLNVVPSTNNGWRRAVGRWEDNAATNNQYNGFWTTDIATEMFRPPYGIRGNLFRSGLVNLNTVKNLRVYKALMSGFSTSTELDSTLGYRLPVGRGAFFNEFLRNRRGYTPDSAAPGISNNFFEPGSTPLQTYDHDDDNNAATAQIPSFDRNIPTQFAGVFKSAIGGNIAPLETMRTTTIDPNLNQWEVAANVERTDLSPLQSTILRRDLDRSGGTQLDKPIFQRAVGDAAVTASQNHERSAVHQQLGITRLSNLATDQSNVFAVWITIGYFEIDSSTMTVGREIGSSDGAVNRPRGFFVVDRSIPVMYEPGVLNNALETVRFSRIAN